MKLRKTILSCLSGPTWKRNKFARFGRHCSFVVLVIGSLGAGLGVTLWLSTDAAERSYQLGHARETNQALLQQKEALERQVL